MPNDRLFFWMFVCHLSHEPCLSQNISIFWRLHSKISTYSQDVSSIAWIALFSLRGSTTIVGLRHSDPKSWNRWTLRGRRRENRARGPNMEERLLTRLDGTGALWYVYFGPKNPSGRFFFLIWSMRSLLYTRLRSFFPIYLCSDQRSSCPSLASSCCPFLLWSRCADWLAPSMGLAPRQQRFTLQ